MFKQAQLLLFWLNNINCCCSVNHHLRLLLWIHDIRCFFFLIKQWKQVVSRLNDVSCNFSLVNSISCCYSGEITTAVGCCYLCRLNTINCCSSVWTRSTIASFEQHILFYLVLKHLIMLFCYSSDDFDLFETSTAKSAFVSVV